MLGSGHQERAGEIRPIPRACVFSVVFSVVFFNKICRRQFLNGITCHMGVKLGEMKKKYMHQSKHMGNIKKNCGKKTISTKHLGATPVFLTKVF